MVGQNQLVNILRGAMAILAAVVQHPPAERKAGSERFGFSALKPALDTYPQFLETLVDRLSSADHSLCLNALQLINALMRDAMLSSSDAGWGQLTKKLQDLGCIKAIHLLMQDVAIQDLATALLDFQGLTKVMFRKWKEVPVDLCQQDHRRALKTVFVTAYPERQRQPNGEEPESKKMHDPEKWRRLGFESESPAWEFEEIGYLGMLDLVDFVHKTEDGFQRMIQEQSSKDYETRCPITKASLSVSSILYDHFEIENADMEELSSYGALELRSSLDKAFKPLLLQWHRLHTGGVRAFMRLWATARARKDDFSKIEELVRILIEEVVGFSPRTRDITEVETMLAAYDLKSLRDLQTKLLEVTHEESWGQHLHVVKDDLRQEALSFIKEQRIRVLLRGTWFPTNSLQSSHTGLSNGDGSDQQRTSWRFVKLSYNRRYLHYDDFDSKADEGKDPALDALEYKIDLGKVSSVVSSLTTSPSPDPATEAAASSETLKSPPLPQVTKDQIFKPKKSHTNTDIVINGRIAPTTTKDENNADPDRPKTHRRNQSSRSTTRTETQRTAPPESALLTLHPVSQTIAAEWLDGLLMLLGQTPITSDTNKLVEFIAGYGLKIRLLNVRFDEPGLTTGAGVGVGTQAVEVPSREGLDEDYFYDVGSA